MARKMLVTQRWYDMLKDREPPHYMSQEQYDKWIEDNVEVLLPFDPEWVLEATKTDGRQIGDA